MRTTQTRPAAILLAALVWSIVAAEPLRSEDKIESAGVTIGSTVGNLIFVPLKAASAFMGALAGALSFVVTGGNAEVSRQIWHNTLQGPYVITPELAKEAIGERPEVELE
jgi:hypothetical protein